MALNKDLLEILPCPTCKGSLEVVGQEEGLRCEACAVVYPIREEIPVMLPEEAVPQSAWDEGRRRAFAAVFDADLLFFEAPVRARTAGGANLAVADLAWSRARSVLGSGQTGRKGAVKDGYQGNIRESAG